MTKDNETISLQQFISENEITMVVRTVAKNPHMPDMPRNFKCTLTSKLDYMSLHFSQGEAHTKPPTITEVLDCLASDAASVENAANFEDWASELGYETDSRKAEKKYKVCVEQAADLRNLLGTEAYEQLLYNTERL